jgi:hypothetical protein
MLLTDNYLTARRTRKKILCFKGALHDWNSILPPIYRGASYCEPGNVAESPEIARNGQNSPESSRQQPPGSIAEGRLIPWIPIGPSQFSRDFRRRSLCHAPHSAQSPRVLHRGRHGVLIVGLVRAQACLLTNPEHLNRVSIPPADAVFAPRSNERRVN